MNQVNIITTATKDIAGLAVQGGKGLADIFGVGNDPTGSGIAGAYYYEWVKGGRYLLIFNSPSKFEGLQTSGALLSGEPSTVHLVDRLRLDTAEEIEPSRWQRPILWEGGSSAVLRIENQTFDEPILDDPSLWREITWKRPRVRSEEYVEVLAGPGRQHEPVIKGKGVPVWVLVAYVQKRGLTAGQVSQLWEGYITPDEVRGAILYQEEFPERVEDHLADEG